MVRVCKRARGDVPRLLPLQLVDVQEDAHEFGDGDGRVGIIEPHGNFVTKGIKGGILLGIASKDILEGGCDKKILLLEA